MSSEYHKIQSIYKRDEKGRFIVGAYPLPEIEYLAGLQWEWTEKVDGTNIRLQIENGACRIGGKTDNAQIPAPLIESIQAMSFHSKLAEVLPAGGILYGEGYGGSIQKAGATYGNPQRFVLFDVRVGDWWLLPDDVRDVGAKLEIPVVPTVGRGTLHEAEAVVKAGLRSTWGDFEAEGLVCRPLVPLFGRRGDRVIVKIKGKDYRNG